MPQYAPVSRERHGQKRWLRPQGFAFAAAEAVAPIVGAELARAAVSMPCAFVEHSGRHTLVAVLSLVPGRNMFVAPDGRWVGPYIPVGVRLYPFRMLPHEGTDRLLLCVDEAGGLLVEGSAAGEAFFDAEGNLAPAVKALFDALMEVERSRKVTDLAVAALAQADVIRPWQIKLKGEGGERPVTGLHRIDEAALRALPDDAFLRLRKGLELPLAYAQLLSMGQLGMFELLAKVQQQAAPPPVAALPESIDHLLENLKGL